MSHEWDAFKGYDVNVSDARIKRIMATTAYPDSLSIHEAMKQLETEIRMEIAASNRINTESLGVDWDVAPEWAQYLAKDGNEDKDWWWYEFKPHINPDDNSDIWESLDGKLRHAHVTNQPDVSWMESLCRRPQ